VALVADYGPEVGAGHISRCRGLIEHITTFEHFQLTCFLPNYGGELKWLNELERKKQLYIQKISFSRREVFSILLCDSYQDRVWNEVIGSRIHYKIPIIDQDHEYKTRIVHGKAIILESFQKFEMAIATPQAVKKTMNSHDFDGLTGTLIWNEKMRELADSQENVLAAERKVVLSLGGSDLIKTETILIINALIALKKRNQLEKIVTYAHVSIENEIQNKFGNLTGFKIEAFSEAFYGDMQTCSLLICGSGTTALEAFHLGVPAVIVNLFSNASSNYMELQKHYENALFVGRPNLSDGEYLVGLFERAITELKRLKPNKKGVINGQDLKVFFDSVIEDESKQSMRLN